MSSKCFVEITGIRKAAAGADIQNLTVGGKQKLTGIFKSLLVQIILKGHTQSILEKMGQITQRQIFLFRKLSQQELPLEILIYIIGNCHNPVGPLLDGGIIIIC